MEYVPNGSLAKLLEHTGGKIPGNLAKFYAAWIIITLEYLESFNITHRDLKP
jgi:serine/threonine protein kinase